MSPFNTEMSNVTLEHASEMPEVIEPLSFTGQLPVVATFLHTEREGMARSFCVEVVNRTNKDLSLIQMDLNCLDSDGNEIHVLQHSEPGFPAVASGETVTIEIRGFLAPDETDSMRPEVIAIRALDATTWSRNE